MPKRTKALTRELHDKGLRRPLAERAARALADPEEHADELREIADGLRGLADELAPSGGDAPAPEPARSEPEPESKSEPEPQPQPGPEAEDGGGDDAPAPTTAPRKRPPSADRIRPRARRT